MYFQEFDCLAAYQLVLFAVGICIMFAGLYVLLLCANGAVAYYVNGYGES